MLYQSYRQVFVTNSPNLLAEGKTVENLAVGQLGFLDAKTYKAVTSPTYAKNKALYAVWGTPDVDLGLYGGVPNENEYSKLIKGKLIKGFRAKKAQRGQTPIWTVGWSGDSADKDTLFAKVGERKSLFIKLSGTAIDRLYSKQGIVKQFVTTPACADSCVDSCGEIKCDVLAKELVSQINSDIDFKKFIRAKAILDCTPSLPIAETDCFKFKLEVCDTGDAMSLGLVQSKYPSDKVVKESRVGAITKYTLIKDVNVAPSDFTTNVTVVPECPTCPAGGTLIPAAKVFEVKVACGATAPSLPGQIEATKISTDPQFDVYIVKVDVAQTKEAVVAAAEAAGCTVANYIGEKRNVCTLPPVTIAWVADGVLKKQEKAYRITLADTVCGTNRLTDLQNAYPNLVVTVVNPAGSCVHTYETKVKSNCYEVGCAIGDIKFVQPSMFEGVAWKEVPAEVIDGSSCKCGIQIESAFVNRKTNECTFDYFPYENDIIHVQISNYNPDFNGDPCEGEWAVKQIRQVKYPQGSGQYIQYLEKESKQYDQRFRSYNPVVREAQGYSLQADPSKFYDEYVLEFDVKWKSAGGWSEDYVESFHLCLFVPEGTGAQLENTLNSYVSSAGVEEDAVSI